MSGKSLFQTGLLILFGVAVVVAVLIFSGILPGFRAQKVGQAGNVVVWGSFPFNTYNQILMDLKDAHKDEFSITYVDQGNNLETALIEALASGQGPDVVIAPHELILKQQNKFTPLPFASLPLRSYQDAFIDEANLFVRGEGFLAVPLAVDPLLLYYNKDLYNNANILKAPTNWEEFIKIQPLLTKVGQNNRINQSAFALGTFTNNNNAKDILSLLILEAGGSPVSSENGQLVVTLDDNFGYTLRPAEAALDFFQQFADPAKSTYCWNRSLPEARESFLAESLSNYFGLASEAPYLRERNPHLNLNLNLVPQMSGQNRLTFGRLYGVAVLRTTTKASAAWPMVFALTGEEFSKKLADALNFAPTRRALLNPDPAQPDQKVIFDSALISRGWYDFYPTATKAIFQTMNDNVATGRLNTQSAVAEANKELAKLLGQ
ncbi:MAG: extracellular solute-binding protein [Candidatus Paceibacterota bacterium]|jgi:ABC-type glycerol-3-phosphate transport system substrate-binding protein